MNHDEVNDPDWMVEWSLSQLTEQRNRGGYYFGPMYRLKDDRVFCSDDGHHGVNPMGGCMDSPARSTREDIVMTRVQVFDEDGNYLRTDFLDLDAEAIAEEAA